MNIIEEKQDNILILRLIGKLDVLNSNVLEEAIQKIISSGELVIAIDCEKLEYISSSGLRVLLMLDKSITKNKGKLALFSLKDNIKEILAISGFTSLFEIFDNQIEAIAGFE
jgi:anti-anti-sigma factor